MRLALLRQSRAFSLVELLIVIIIIAVLAAVAIPRFANSSQRSKESALRADLKLYRNAIELFKADCGVYPASLSDLAATTAPANGLDSSGNTVAINASDWKGSYIQTIETDPISGNAFTYGTTAGSVGKVTSSAGAPYNTWQLFDDALRKGEFSKNPRQVKFAQDQGPAQ